MYEFTALISYYTFTEETQLATNMIFSLLPHYMPLHYFEANPKFIISPVDVSMPSK